MNNIWTIVISAATGGIFTLITAYITTAISAKKERNKWESETAIKFIDYSISNPELAKKVARQFSIAVIVILDEDGTTNRKYFLPAFCRFSVGRLDDHDICIDDSYLSRDHGLFYYKKGKIIYKDTSPTNRSTVNGKEILRSRRLKSGDILLLGHTNIKFEEL
jgi:pSer/pThr/pTyr-binding forkhead associated (FHA) protein